MSYGFSTFVHFVFFLVNFAFVLAAGHNECAILDRQ